MVFYSDVFTFNDICSKDVNISLVYEDSDILNSYGVPFSIEDNEQEVTLSFCYSQDNVPLKWDSEVIGDFLGWMITDDYCEFISEDDENISYFLKGIGYEKRFTHDMTGIIDITFKALSNYAYRSYIKSVEKPSEEFIVQNDSNVSKPCKPIIEIGNISSESISIYNFTTNKEPFIINTRSSENITIDNETGVVINDKGENLIMDCNRKWVEISKGDNIMFIEGDCDITFKVYYPVMV